ncbi:DUF4376 domain-containing protein [Methylobacterium brachiatum]|uniref:DUF4376 domain-containing protein n=1 Tax=Methylobacterium brachiatum TaxID=269660 RepID=UPI00244C7675|nr:DUF4376 domain-containing protein [Methylobacterium brachiatum]MDH2313159.1 DUF4376 domain-containing protein [Methylobacterium brachiatum]
MTEPLKALIVDGRVHELDVFPEGTYHPALDVRDVSGVAGIAVGWIVDSAGVFSAPTAVPPTVAELVAYSALKRYAVETGGITVNGLRVATDRDSQSMVANAYAGMQATGAASVKFKAASGWIELNLDQIKALAVAVFGHVQACFAAEDACDAGINAGPPTIATFADVDAAFASMSPAD